MKQNTAVIWQNLINAGKKRGEIAKPNSTRPLGKADQNLIEPMPR
jgi:hypothetical protein